MADPCPAIATVIRPDNHYHRVNSLSIQGLIRGAPQRAKNLLRAAPNRWYPNPLAGHPMLWAPSKLTSKDGFYNPRQN